MWLREIGDLDLRRVSVKIKATHFSSSKETLFSLFYQHYTSFNMSQPNRDQEIDDIEDRKSYTGFRFESPLLMHSVPKTKSSSNVQANVLIKSIDNSRSCRAWSTLAMTLDGSI